MSAPVVSVIMAAYNGASMIGETLASLSAQTFTDFEVVIVDDRSTDDTLAVARGWPDPRIRVIAAEVNGGPVRARNRAFAEARGRYVAGLDQDDVCRPERLARQVAYLDANPDIVVLGTASEVLQDGAISPSTYPPVTTPKLIQWLMWIENPLVWSSIMVRGDAARTLDPFTRPEILYAEDFDLYHRMRHLGGIARLDAELLLYRRHGNNASYRFLSTMADSAGRVLTAAYAPLFGDDAAAASALVVTHMMGRFAAPDRETLRRLGAVLTRLQADFLAHNACTPADSKLIRWETARRWAGVARAGLRAGTLTLGDAIAVRPDHLGLGHAGIDELIVSWLVGSVRQIRKRQTLAA